MLVEEYPDKISWSRHWLRPHLHNLKMSAAKRIISTTIAVATRMCSKNQSSLLPTKTTTKIGIKNWETLIKRKFEVYYYVFRVGVRGGGGARVK